jgi:hypothetical protein
MDARCYWVTEIFLQVGRVAGLRDVVWVTFLGLLVDLMIEAFGTGPTRLIERRPDVRITKGRRGGAVGCVKNVHTRILEAFLTPRDLHNWDCVRGGDHKIEDKRTICFICTHALPTHTFR